MAILRMEMDAALYVRLKATMTAPQALVSIIPVSTQRMSQVKKNANTQHLALIANQTVHARADTNQTQLAIVNRAVMQKKLEDKTACVFHAERFLKLINAQVADHRSVHLVKTDTT